MMVTEDKRKSVSMAESAYLSLKEEILRNRFPSGEFISIRDLSAALEGMGRTPVREAVQRLHDERLLTVVPRKGVIIPEFDIKKMMDQLELRHVLERFATVKAAPNIDDETLKDLEDILSDMGSVEGKSSYKLARLNMSFHLKIAEAAGNRELFDALSRIYDHHIRIYTFFLTDPNRFNATQDEHWQILDAVRSGDRKKIEAAIDAHFRNTRSEILASILK
jgi:DNA-binding GntR family transcriptional regulator